MWFIQAWASYFTGKPVELENASVANFPAKNLIIAMTTDKVYIYIYIIWYRCVYIIYSYIYI